MQNVGTCVLTYRKT